MVSQSGRWRTTTAQLQKLSKVSDAQTNAVGSVTSTTTVPTQFCQYVIPWSAGSDVKFNASYPLPKWGLGMIPSVVYQNLPGYLYNTSYVATNAQVAAISRAQPCGVRHEKPLHYN